MNKKFVYQVGNNKKVILWCTANQVSRTTEYVQVHMYIINNADVLALFLGKILFESSFIDFQMWKKFCLLIPKFELMGPQNIVFQIH